MKLRNLSLILCLTAHLLSVSCANQDRSSTNVSQELRAHTTVVKDEIPAEGERKIPVVEQY